MEIKKMLCKSRFSELAVGKLSAEDAYTRLKSLQREWEIKHSRGQLNLRGWCRWAGGLWLWLASLRFFSLFNKKWVSSTGKHTNYLQSTAFNDEQKGTERESLDLMITLNSARTRRRIRFLPARCSPRFAQLNSEYQNNKGNSKTFPVNFMYTSTRSVSLLHFFFAFLSPRT